MDSILKYKIDNDIVKNKYYYYFTLLSNRFDILNDKFTEILSKKYNKQFKPIFILSSEPSKFYKKENYIIVNKNLVPVRKNEITEKIINLQDYEDLNVEFKNSSFIRDIIKSLIKKQNEVFIYSFTSYGLDFKDERVRVFGPNYKIVEKYDNKIEQIKLFKNLKLSVNETKIYNSFEDIKKIRDKIDYPIFISPSFTSGGAENKIIFKEEDLDSYYLKLRKINLNKKFFVAKYIKDVVSSPNSTAIVCGKNDTRLILISNQILRGGMKHLGNVYPFETTKKINDIISDSTIKIGNYLSKIGYRGLFGCDFIVDKKENCYIVDLNPRRQGGYLMVYLMSNKYNLLDLEFRVFLNETIPNFDYEDFQREISWSHSKIKPHEKYSKIKKEFIIGSEALPFKRIGEKFVSIFYPKNYIINDCYYGYYIVSGKSYKKVSKRTKKEINDIMDETLEDI
jgi:predicted ATP-grasp superfamily ATP-dependent carboligase